MQIGANGISGNSTSAAAPQSRKQTRNEEFIIKQLTKTLGGQLEFAFQTFFKAPIFCLNLVLASEEDKII